MNPTPGPPGLDQRRIVRARVRFAARYVSSSLTIEGHVTDVSPDGMFFSSDYLDAQGETVRVWVDLPSRGRPVELRAEVRWVNDSPHGGGMGLRLIDVALDDRALLASLYSGALAVARSGHA